MMQGIRSAAIAGLFIAAASGTSAMAQSTSITSNFNGTSLTNPTYVWFSSHMTSLSGVPAAGGTLFFTNQTIKIVDSSLPGGQIVLNVPDGSVTIDPLVGSPSITFDAAGSHTTIASVANDPILSVLAWQVPLPTTIDLAGANPITWSGNVSLSWLPTTTVTMNWQWAAAAYKPFTTDYSAMGVIPIDQDGAQSGTPMNYTDNAIACLNVGAGDNCLVGGARGGGGSNYTGSNSGTVSIKVTDVNSVPEPATLFLVGSGLLGVLPMARRKRR